MEQLKLFKRDINDLIKIKMEELARNKERNITKRNITTELKNDYYCRFCHKKDYYVSLSENALLIFIKFKCLCGQNFTHSGIKMENTERYLRESLICECLEKATENPFEGYGCKNCMCSCPETTFKLDDDCLKLLFKCLNCGHSEVELTYVAANYPLHSYKNHLINVAKKYLLVKL